MRLILLAVSILNLLSAGEFWNDRKAADWTKEERERILEQSPWAKTVSAGVDVTRGAVPRAVNSNRSSGMQGRYGGMATQTGGMRTGGSRAPEGIPDVRAVVRWESAAPIREASAKPLPEDSKGHIVLSVTMTGMLTVSGGQRPDAGGPTNAEEEMLRATSLQAKGKPPVNPDRLWRDEKTGTTYFLFGDRDAITSGDKEWVFETSFGQMTLKTKFASREMHYLGKPAL
jgi:hypothetical protein